jgi:hypothetical protein
MLMPPIQMPNIPEQVKSKEEILFIFMFSIVSNQ